MSGSADDPVTRELQHWMTHELDIAGCGRLEIVVPLYDEHETAGLFPETWPEAVRNLVIRFTREFFEREPRREARAISFGTQKTDQGTKCVVIVHHAGKAREDGRKRPDGCEACK